MAQFIKYAVVVAVYVPYRMSELSRDSSFLQDFLVVFGAFALGAGLGYLVEKKSK